MSQLGLPVSSPPGKTGLLAGWLLTSFQPGCLAQMSIARWHESLAVLLPTVNTTSFPSLPSQTTFVEQPWQDVIGRRGYFGSCKTPSLNIHEWDFLLSS